MWQIVKKKYIHYTTICTINVDNWKGFLNRHFKNFNSVWFAKPYKKVRNNECLTIKSCRLCGTDHPVTSFTSSWPLLFCRNSHVFHTPPCQIKCVARLYSRATNKQNKKNEADTWLQKEWLCGTQRSKARRWNELELNLFALQIEHGGKASHTSVNNSEIS